MAKKTIFDKKYYLSGLPIENVLSATLRAIVDAQSNMAEEQLRLLMDMCFNHDGHMYKPKMIEMEVTRGVLKARGNPERPPIIEQVTARFYIPLITLFPINILGIEDVDLDFAFEITSQYSGETKSKEKSANEELKAYRNKPNVKLLGNIGVRSNDQPESESLHTYNKSRSQSVDIHIDVGVLPLSKGLLEVINVYSKMLDLADMPEVEGNNKD